MKIHPATFPGLLLALLLAAGGTPPSPSTGAAAKPSATPPAMPPARPPKPVPLASLQIPTEPSPRPTLDEWKTATSVQATRRSIEAGPCRVYVVREWLKVYCDASYMGIEQLAGSPKDVLLWVAPINRELETAGVGADTVVRMAPGDRRLFQLYSVDASAYSGIWAELSLVIDETWIEGATLPTVILR